MLLTLRKLKSYGKKKIAGRCFLYWKSFSHLKNVRNIRRWQSFRKFISGDRFVFPTWPRCSGTFIISNSITCNCARGCSTTPPSPLPSLATRYSYFGCPLERMGAQRGYFRSRKVAVRWDVRAPLSLSLSWRPASILRVETSAAVAAASVTGLMHVKSRNVF